MSVGKWVKKDRFRQYDRYTMIATDGSEWTARVAQGRLQVRIVFLDGPKGESFTASSLEQAALIVERETNAH